MPEVLSTASARLHIAFEETSHLPHLFRIRIGKIIFLAGILPQVIKLLRRQIGGLVLGRGPTEGVR